MKKTIRLSESELMEIIKKVINENEDDMEKTYEDFIDRLKTGRGEGKTYRSRIENILDAARIALKEERIRYEHFKDIKSLAEEMLEG